MRLLLIEDDENLCTVLRFQLEQEGYSVEVCHDGEEGLFLLREGGQDMVLLDRMLPTMDGLTVLRTARREEITTPILMLTALGLVSDKTAGLNEGADDYLVKPFAFEELTARIRCILRRPAVLRDTERLSLGDITFEPKSLTLTCGKNSSRLSRRLGDLLALFLRNPGQVLPRGTILLRVWGGDSEVEDGNLDNYIYFLRRQLGQVGSRLTVTTLRGVGYCLEDPHV